MHQNVRYQLLRKSRRARRRVLEQRHRNTQTLERCKAVSLFLLERADRWLAET